MNIQEKPSLPPQKISTKSLYQLPKCPPLSIASIHNKDHLPPSKVHKRLGGKSCEQYDVTSMKSIVLKEIEHLQRHLNEPVQHRPSAKAILDAVYIKKHLNREGDILDITGHCLAIPSWHQDFSQFTLIKEIKAAENFLSLETFKSFLKLERLDLTLNYLKVLPQVKQYSYLNLKALQLGFNELRGQALEALEKLQHLESLSLECNSLRSVPKEKHYTIFPSLKLLDLRGNKLNGIQSFYYLSRIPNLEVLNLESNGISGLPTPKMYYQKTILDEENVTPFKNLKILLLAHNRICNEKVLQILWLCPCLKNLDISYNQIIYFPEELALLSEIAEMKANLEIKYNLIKPNKPRCSYSETYVRVNRVKDYMSADKNLVKTITALTEGTKDLQTVKAQSMLNVRHECVPRIPKSPTLRLIKKLVIDKPKVLKEPESSSKLCKNKIEEILQKLKKLKHPSLTNLESLETKKRYKDCFDKYK